MNPSLVASSAALLAVVALPAAADAATLTVNKRCYREGSEAIASGQGFTPNSQVNFTLDGQDFTRADQPPFADAAGNLNAGFEVGTPRAGGRVVAQKDYVLGASDGTNSGQTTFTATRLDVNVTPKRGNPGKRKRVKARGFDQGRMLRFHVRGPRKRNGRVGKAKGPCGKVNRKIRVFGSTFPTGVYTVQFDQRRKYTGRRAVPRVVFQVTIFQTVRGAIAGAAFTPGETWTPLD